MLLAKDLKKAKRVGGDSLHSDILHINILHQGIIRMDSNKINKNFALKGSMDLEKITFITKASRLQITGH